MKWFVDCSFAVHNDMKGHTGGGMTLGKGSTIKKVQNKKLIQKVVPRQNWWE